MDIVTGITIVAGVVTVCGTALASLKYLKKPDETWKLPMKAVEKKHENFRNETEEKIKSVENRLVRVETHVEGIEDIKKNISSLDKKIENLTQTILNWIHSRTN